MKNKIQSLFNFVHDNLGCDTTIIGLSGLKKKTVYIYITIPKGYKKAHIQNTETNYLLS